VWTGEEKFSPTRISFPGHPFRSKSLYELGFGPQCRDRISDKVINESNGHITAYLYAKKELKFQTLRLMISYFCFATYHLEAH
jgi:hypothetical protein